MEERTIEQVLKSHTLNLMSVSGVVGTAIGAKEGKPCILVLVMKKSEEVVRKIPSELESYPVVIQEVGRISSRED